MRFRAFTLTCLLLLPASSCKDDCDCLPDRTILSFTLTDGEFAAGSYTVELRVDGELRATCSSVFADSPQDQVSCDDPAVEVDQGRARITAELPEFDEGASISVELRDEQSAVWAGSAVVEAQGYSAWTCACWQGMAEGELALSAGG